MGQEMGKARRIWTTSHRRIKNRIVATVCNSTLDIGELCVSVAASAMRNPEDTE